MITPERGIFGGNITVDVKSKELVGKKVLLLDMNSTFMFGEDRFGSDEDYSTYYGSLDGVLSGKEVNEIISGVFEYLSECYPNEKYRYTFPSVEHAIKSVTCSDLPQHEVNNLVATFAFHEHGHIPDEYVAALIELKQSFVLAGVIDIWSPKQRWLETFKRLGIDKLFSALSFSSDHGMVKPSPKPFELVVRQLGVSKQTCMVIGDSVRRDLGGALAAGIDCILIGRAQDPRALSSYPSLLDLCKHL